MLLVRILNRLLRVIERSVSFPLFIFVMFPIASKLLAGTKARRVMLKHFKLIIVDDW